ncbi:MAG TPA: Rieske 2Fe-2S domain-containing protein [Nocardioidaceae bacterium]|nr:Rieske 2Fe-2S domain-containing protein [Nocardioidaceae bacterium]
MSEWVKVADMKELARRRKKVVNVDGEDVVLFAAGEKVYALRDTCIHEQRSLAKGTLFNGRVICPGHQWQFDLASGWEETQERCQPTYEVKVEGDEVHLNTQQRVLAEND